MNEASKRVVMDLGQLCRSTVLTVAACLLGVSAHAQGSYPDRPIRMIVGYPPGQSSDVQAREIARLMSKTIGQNVFVDNKPGAGGIIGMEAAKNAAPDGYTLIYSSSGPIAMNPAIYKKLPYDTVQDFIPIQVTNTNPVFLIASKSFPPNNVPELLAYVKAHPGAVSYASGGAGGSGHIAMEMLKLATQATDILHVPYNGTSAALIALIGGQVQIMFDPGGGVLPQVRAGNAKVLGVASKKRMEAVSNVPTIAEQGVPNFEVAPWGIVMAPKGTPKAIVDKLRSEVRGVLNSAEFDELMTRNVAVRSEVEPGDLSDFIRSEIAKWTGAIKAAGIEPN